jgi:hypothetical protein
MVQVAEGEGWERYTLRGLETGIVTLPPRLPYLKGWLQGRFVTAKRFWKTAKTGVAKRDARY